MTWTLVVQCGPKVVLRLTRRAFLNLTFGLGFTDDIYCLDENDES
jgi:hypothetical protein